MLRYFKGCSEATWPLILLFSTRQPQFPRYTTWSTFVLCKIVHNLNAVFLGAEGHAVTYFMTSPPLICIHSTLTLDYPHVPCHCEDKKQHFLSWNSLRVHTASTKPCRFLKISLGNVFNISSFESTRPWWLKKLWVIFDFNINLKQYWLICFSLDSVLQWDFLRTPLHILHSKQSRSRYF